MGIRPIEDRVILRPNKEAETTTASGLVLASKQDELPSEGTVVAKGSGMHFANGDFMELDLEVGDKVMFAKYSGTEIEYNGETLIVIPYRDIYAVLED